MRTVKKAILIIMCMIIFTFGIQNPRVNILRPMNVEAVAITLTTGGAALLIAILGAMGISFATTQYMNNMVDTLTRMMGQSTVNQLNALAASGQEFDMDRFIVEIPQIVIDTIRNYVVTSFGNYVDGNRINHTAPNWMQAINVDGIPMLDHRALVGLFGVNAAENQIIQRAIIGSAADEFYRMLPSSVDIMGITHTASVYITANNGIADRIRLHSGDSTILAGAISPRPWNWYWGHDVLGFYLGNVSLQHQHLPELRVLLFSYTRNPDYLNIVLTSALAIAHSQLNNAMLQFINVDNMTFSAALLQPNIIQNNDDVISAMLAEAGLVNWLGATFYFAIPRDHSQLLNIQNPGQVIVHPDAIGNPAIPDTPAIPQDWLDAIERDLAAGAAAGAAAAAGILALPYALGGTMQFYFTPSTPGRNRITTIFPFSIPFSFGLAITTLRAPAVPPRFEADFSGTVLDGGTLASAHGIEGLNTGGFNLVIDFAWLENLAMVIRWTVWIGFFVGLMFLTNKVIRW